MQKSEEAHLEWAAKVLTTSLIVRCDIFPLNHCGDTNIRVLSYHGDYGLAYGRLGWDRSTGSLFPRPLMFAVTSVRDPAHLKWNLVSHLSPREPFMPVHINFLRFSRACTQEEQHRLFLIYLGMFYGQLQALSAVCGAVHPITNALTDMARGLMGLTFGKTVGFSNSIYNREFEG